MTCLRCQAETPSDAEFCPECGAKLTVVCARCRTANAPGHKFCKKCGQPLAAAAQAPVAVRFASPEAYTPKHLAEKILTSRSALEGERKQVTVLFADLKGSMELLADRDPEEARKLLDPVLEHMMEAVHRFEGTVNQVMGDGIMALFGAPLAHEDHAVRACYAALRMQESVRRYAEGVRRTEGVPIQIRVGLNSGEVVVRSIGSDLHMDYTAVGQTTHLAARMEQLATPGTILLTAETLRLAEGFVQVRPLGPVPVKGLETPIEVYEITGAGPARSRLQAAAARGLTRFVGRETELDQLRQALERARAGQGQVVALVGEPGVGKSRLFWEFTHSHRTHGWLILESGSVSYGKATGYLPVLDLLKGYFKIETPDDTRTIREKVTGKVLTLDRTLEETIPAVLALLDALPEESPFQMLDPPQRRQRILEGVKRLLLRESHVQPWLLVFEDLHWIDPETQSLLDSLIESLPTARVLLLVNYRPEYQHGWGSKTYYAQLRLDPLPIESCEELLRALLGDGASLEPLKRLLIERAERNPFFLEESVRTLIETKVLVGEGGGYRLAKALPTVQVPATVQAVLAARIDRLPPEEKALLQSAAVIGKDVPFALLQALGGLPEEELRRRLSRLQAAEFLYETSLFPELEYTFKHALTHQVAYSGLLHERTKVLHARVVEALQRLAGERWTEQAEVLARHAVRGEVWDKAVDALREAGSRAYARGAIQETLERYEQALELLPKLPASPENIRRAIDLRWSFFGPLISLGQVPRLAQLLQEAEQLARQLDDQPRLGGVSAMMGACSVMNARYAEGIEHAQRALGIATTIGDPELRVRSTYVLGMGHLGLGDARAAVDLFTRIVEGPDADLARRLAGIFGSLYGMSCCWLALCYMQRGDLERARECADRGVQAADASDVPQAQAFAYYWRANALAAKGEVGQALPWLDRAVHLCETGGLLYMLSVASTGWGWALARAGRPAEGLPALERGMALQEGMGTKFFVSFFYVLWAEGLLLGGQIEEAKRVADRAVELALASGERGSEGWAFYLLGEIAAVGDLPDLASAFTSYERARALAEELGMRPLLARCHLSLGHLYRRAGNGAKAREHLTMGATLFREMDMRFWLEQAEAALKELG
ncbi:MAG: AAA family ATPase [Candidatus Rokubacteria bacterium]|nr:AAA family ATPase [Candidatus Rokubacteria bacterium]